MANTPKFLNASFRVHDRWIPNAPRSNQVSFEPHTSPASEKHPLVDIMTNLRSP